MNHSRFKPVPRRFVFVGALVLTAILAYFVVIPCVLELGSRPALGRDLVMLKVIDAAVRNFQREHNQFPASLEAPEFRSYLEERDRAFLREGRIVYHSPASESPPTFIILELTTPRGKYFMQLDGTPIYPSSK